MIDEIETSIEIIILTETWLGLDNISINNFQITGNIAYAAINNKIQNDGIVVYLKTH